MKKKSVFLSKVFAVALAAAMAVSAPNASAAVVSGTTTYETPQEVTSQASTWWTGFSDAYKVSGDFDITLDFTNKSVGTNAWFNYIVIFSSVYEAGDSRTTDLNTLPGYKEYYVCRADAWGWSPSPGGDNMTMEGNQVTYEGWDDAVLAALSDANVSLNIKRTGGDVVMTANITGKDSAVHTVKYNLPLGISDDMCITLTGESADIALKSVTYNTGATPTDKPVNDDTDTPSTDTTTPPAIGVPDDTTPPTNDTPDTVAPPTDDTPDAVEPPADDTEDPGDDTDDSEAPAPTISKKKKTLKIGKSFTLKVKNAEGKVKWSSSKKKVAKVNKNGKVTALKKGKATIKAKVDGKTLKCVVTVKK